MMSKQARGNRSVRERRVARRVARVLAALVPAVSLLTTHRAEAINYFYDNDSSTPGFGTAGGSWLAPTPGPTPGWTTDGTGSVVPGSVTTLTTDTVNFGNGATGLGAGTITVGTVSSGSMTFASGSGAIVLSGGTINLAPATTITVNNAADTINSILAGVGSSVTKAGTGTLNLTGVNTYTGGTTLGASAGQINATVNATQNSIGTGAASIGTGSTLRLDNTNTTTNTTIGNTFTGTGLLNLNFAAGTTARNTTMANVTGFNGVIQLSNSGVNGDKWNASGINAPLAIVQVDNNSQLFVSGADTFERVDIIGNGNSENRGAIRLASTLTAPITLLGSASIGTEGGTITGNISSGAVGTQTLTFGTGSSTGNATINGIIGGGTGTIDVVKTQAGTLTLNNAGSTFATLAVNGGVLAAGQFGNKVDAAGFLGIDDDIALGGGTLRHTGALETSDKDFVLTANSTIESSGSGITLSGNITDTGVNVGQLTVTKSSAGAVTLNRVGSIEVRTLNVNNATAAINIGASTLILLDNNGAQAIGSTSGGTISGGTIQISADSDDFGTANNTTLTINSLITGGTYEVHLGGNAAGVSVLANSANTFSTLRVGTGILSAAQFGNKADATGFLGTDDNIEFITGAGTLRHTGVAETSDKDFVFSANGTIESTGGGINISGVVSGGGAISKTAAGTLALSGANIHTGAITVTEGILQVGSNSALGTTASGTTVLRGANLQLDGARAIGAETLTFGGAETTGGTSPLLSTSGAGNKSLAGNLVGNENFTVDSSVAGTLLTLSGNVNLKASVMTVSGPGDTLISGVISNAFNASGVASGLREMTINGNAFDEVSPNISGNLTPGVTQGNTNTGWADNRTFIYTGQFFDADGIFTFAEQIDDNVRVVIDGATRLRSTNWDIATGTHQTNGLRNDGASIAGANPFGGTTNFGMGPNGDGWHNIEIRLGNGGGGSGPQSQQGWVNTSKGFAFFDGASPASLNGSNFTVITDPGNASIFRTLAPAAPLVKTGTGTLTLTNANTYGGGTTVNQGVLLVNNASGSGLGTGNVVVNSGATLGGSGAFTGDLLLNTGAILAPDGSLGTGSLTFGNNAIYNWEVGDVVNVLGDLTFVGNSIVNIIDNGSQPLGTHALFTWTGALTGFNPGSFTLNQIGFGYSFTSRVYADFGSNTIFLENVVPEPGTAALGLLGLAALARRRRLA